MSPPDNDEGVPGKGRPVTIPNHSVIDTNTSANATTSLVVGTRVRCERTAPARGSWKRYAGRTGVVVSVNVSRSVNPAWPDVVEYGVSFDNTHNISAWFLPHELVITATSGRLSDATTEAAS